VEKQFLIGVLTPTKGGLGNWVPPKSQDGDQLGGRFGVQSEKSSKKGHSDGEWHQRNKPFKAGGSNGVPIILGRSRYGGSSATTIGKGSLEGGCPKNRQGGIV